MKFQMFKLKDDDSVEVYVDLKAIVAIEQRLEASMLDEKGEKNVYIKLKDGTKYKVKDTVSNIKTYYSDISLD